MACRRPPVSRPSWSGAGAARGADRRRHRRRPRHQTYRAVIDAARIDAIACWSVSRRPPRPPRRPSRGTAAPRSWAGDGQVAAPTPGRSTAAAATARPGLPRRPDRGSRRSGIARALHTELRATAALLRDGQISSSGRPGRDRVPRPRPRPPPRRRRADRPAPVAGCAPRAGAAAGPPPRLRRRPAGLRGPRPHRPHRPAGQAAPGPDTRACSPVFLPGEQGLACWAALRTHTDTVKNTGDPRTRDQIMADTLDDRLTGRPAGATCRPRPAPSAAPTWPAKGPAARPRRRRRSRRAPADATTATGHFEPSRAGPAP